VPRQQALNRDEAYRSIAPGVVPGDVVTTKQPIHDVRIGAVLSYRLLVETSGWKPAAESPADFDGLHLAKPPQHQFLSLTSVFLR
jgi:hypothetical protein